MSLQDVFEIFEIKCFQARYFTHGYEVSGTDVAEPTVGSYITVVFYTIQVRYFTNGRDHLVFDHRSLCVLFPNGCVRFARVVIIISNEL